MHAYLRGLARQVVYGGPFVEDDVENEVLFQGDGLPIRCQLVKRHGALDAYRGQTVVVRAPAAQNCRCGVSKGIPVWAVLSEIDGGQAQGDVDGNREHVGRYDRFGGFVGGKVLDMHPVGHGVEVLSQAYRGGPVVAEKRLADVGRVEGKGYVLTFGKVILKAKTGLYNRGADVEPVVDHL